MKSKLKLCVATFVLAGAASAGTAIAADSQSQIPASGEKVAGAPFEVKRDWGTFKLAERIAARVKAGGKVNYVFSYQASGIPLFSPQDHPPGFDTGCKLGNAIYPVDCASIAPVQTDPNQQVSQIEAKLAAGEIDCISIEPTTSDLSSPNASPPG